jgi:hypothetical protein
MTMGLVIPLAHPGHWIESLAFAAPALLLPVALAVMVLRERRRERREASGNPG